MRPAGLLLHQIFMLCNRIGPSLHQTKMLPSFPPALTTRIAGDVILRDMCRFSEASRRGFKTALQENIFEVAAPIPL